MRDKEIDKLFEHNKTVALEGQELEADPPKDQYNEEDVSHFKSKLFDDGFQIFAD